MNNYKSIFGEVPGDEKGYWELVELYFSPLKNLYKDPEITEIFVDRFDKICVEKKGRIVKVVNKFASEETLNAFILQIANTLNQTIDNDNAILDARLPDSSRLCCTLPDVTPQGATVNLRIAPKKTLTPKDLVNLGALTQEMLDFLIEHIHKGSNFLVSGNTGSGKTTLLRALAHFLPKDERIVTCEDTQELYLDWLENLRSMEAPSREKTNNNLESLIHASLRMRPDRIWVGEIRHGDAADAFLQAINTGHQGCASTIHANNCEDAIKRMQYLIAGNGGISFDLAGQQILGSLQLLIHVNRSREGRKVKEIAVIENNNIVGVF